MLKILLDENIHKNIIKRLKYLGYDVLSITESSDLIGLSDEQIITLSLKEKRIILTHDKDFGELLEIHSSQSPLKVILLRYYLINLEKIEMDLEKALELIKEEKLEEKAFIIVIDESGMRLRTY